MAVSPLLAIAAGALKGATNNRAEKRERQQQELEQELKLRSTPGVSLEVDGVRGALDTAAALIPSLGGSPGTPGGGTAPGQSAGTVQSGGRTLDVRFDPTQTLEGRRVAQDTANRAAHAKLSKVDPTLYSPAYDPDFDYGSAERDEQKKGHTEQQLIAAGWDATRAKLFARTGLDSEKSAAEKQTREQAATRLKLEERRVAAAERSADATAGARAQATAEKTGKAAEDDAAGTALAWAMEGGRQGIDEAALQQQIADALPAMFPTLTHAQRVGIAASAILKRKSSDSSIAAKDRSNPPKKPGGVKLPNGVTLPAAAPVKTTSQKADPAKARKQAIDELVDAGKSKEEIKAELKKRGLL